MYFVLFLVSCVLLNASVTKRQRRIEISNYLFINYAVSDKCIQSISLVTLVFVMGHDASTNVDVMYDRWLILFIKF